jgi:DNA-binding MarR family transcriptional regulator
MSSEFPVETTQLTQCATELMEAMPSVMQFIRAEMRSQSASLLSVPQFRVLAFLSLHPGASLSEVAEHLGVTRATASAMTERLVQRGLVNRSTHPQERRQVELTLTTEGLTHLQQSREKTRDKIAVLMAGLTEEQLGNLSRGLAILKQVFTATNF